MRSRGRLAVLAGLAAIVAAAVIGCESSSELGPVANVSSARAIREAFAKGATAGPEKKAAPVGTGWATLSGQFIYDGNPPTMPPYAVTKEPEICTINGKAPAQETLVVDPGTKGIKNVLIYLRDASRVNPSAAPKTDAVVFDQKHCVFQTHVLGLTVGESMDIKNSDPTGHNTNILGAGFNQLIPAGAAIPYKIQREATVPFKVTCSIHPWMTAWMLPRKDGYFAVTDDQGKFQIPNVPAGEPLEFQVWHESGAAAGSGLVGTTPDAKDIKWSNRGRMSLTLQPDEQKQIKVVVPASAFRG